MLLHWLTSAWRSLIANPLFSLITVISLSIGCCGALLAGSNILQHLSFDRWVPDNDRIWVIVQTQPPSFGTFTGPGNLQPNVRTEGAAPRPLMAVTTPMRDAIAGKIPGLEAQGRVMRSQILLQDDQDEQDRIRAAGPPPPGDLPRPFTGTGYIDEDFLKMFPLTFIEGSANGLMDPDHIVLTESRAKRLFGDKPAVGQTVKGIKGRELSVVGVVRDLPVATHLAFGSLTGIRTLESIIAAQKAADDIPPRAPGSSPPAAGAIIVIRRPSMNDWTFFMPGGHYLKMAAGTDPVAFKANAIAAIQAAGDQGAQQTSRPEGMPASMVYTPPKFSYTIVPLRDIHLGGSGLVGVASTGDITMLATLAAGSLALLGVSAFNYVTLSLARALRRRREVAIRKVLGAGQGSLVQQYLVESGMVTVFSLLLGFVLAWFLHPWFARAIGQQETLFSLFDPAFLLWTLAGFVVIALAVSAYPAFYLANVRPRTALGEGGAAAPGRVGQFVTASLLGLQIASATGLLVVSMTMGAQASYIETRPMGFVMKDRYQFFANCPLSGDLSGPQLQALFTRCNTGMKDVVKKTPAIEQAFYFNGSLMSDTVQTTSYGRSAAGEETGRAIRMSVDADFVQGMGATLLAGRFLDPKSAYDRQAIDRPNGPSVPGAPPLPKIEVLPVLISRAALPIVGAVAPQEAIGQRFAARPTTPTTYEVVGVVEDWQVRPLKYSVTSVIFVPSPSQNAVLQIPKDKFDAVKASLADQWRAITGDPKATIQLTSMAQMQERSYLVDYRLMRAVSSFALVAIIVAGLGVFGLSTFEMRRRVREIGIRKSLGAAPLTVAARIIGRQVAFAAAVSLLAWPVGFWIGNQWLLGFVYRTSLGWLMPAMATLLVVIFVAAAVGLSSARAAAMRPRVALQ